MDRLISKLAPAGARAYLHISGKMDIEEGVSRLIKALKIPHPIVLVTVQRGPEIPGVTALRLFQISQTLLDLLFDRDVLLIIEAAVNLGEFTVSPKRGRIVVVGSDFKSWEELTESVKFLGEHPTTTLEAAKILSSMGFQLLDPSCKTSGPECRQYGFSYQGLTVTVPMVTTQFHEYQARLPKNDALPITNFLYPPQYQILHNVSRLTRPEMTPDLVVSDGGWVGLDTLREINQWSPKLS